jgi:Mrp family chromosome partitioning ATPase
MSLKRWLRLSAARWWILVLVAAVGGTGGFLLARSGNQSIEPVFEGRAVFEFTAPDDSERNAPDAAADLATAAAVATEANSEIIEQGQATITADDRALTLTFGARSRDEETVRALVTDMQLTYLTFARDSAELASEARVAEIVTEAAAILGELEALAPPGVEPIVVDPAVQAELDFVNSQVSGLTQRSNQLAVDKVLAEIGDPDNRVGTVEEIEEELVLIEGKLQDLYAQIAQLTLGGATSSRDRTTEETPAEGSSRDTFEPVEPDSLETTWTIEALQARFDELRAEHQDLLIAAQSPVSIEESVVDVEVTDLSPGERSVPVTAVLGLIVGALLAFGAVVAHYRIRRPMYVVQDLPATIAGVEMPRAVRTSRRRPDRSSEMLGKRAKVGRVRRSIRRSNLARATAVANQRQVRARELRNAVVEWSESSLLVGLSGAGVEAREVVAVALELARALAASDRSVLILNLDFSTAASDAGLQGSGVSDLLASLRRDPGSGPVAVKEALADAIIVAPRIRMVLAGSLGGDPSDVFVTSAFRSLLGETREHADVVLVVLSPLEEPATELARQRLDGVIAVGRLGHTRRSDLRESAGNGGGQLAGAVLLTKWPRLGLRERLVAKSAPSGSRLHERAYALASADAGFHRADPASRRIRSLSTVRSWDVDAGAETTNESDSNGSGPGSYAPDMADDSLDYLDTIEFDLDSMDATADDDSGSIVDSSAAWGDNPQRSRKRRIS